LVDGRALGCRDGGVLQDRCRIATLPGVDRLEDRAYFVVVVGATSLEWEITGAVLCPDGSFSPSPACLAAASAADDNPDSSSANGS
jgi:hypothetical protein